MSETLPTEVTVLADVNVLAVGLIDDHPVHDDVYPWLQNALDGPNVLLVFDYYPLRAVSEWMRSILATQSSHSCRVRRES
ncbi:hypothetical protein ACFOZ7_22810 [Natribaculum luteum]|uniref:PIN domain-containing protein n=1 Tax=Natribaculum luteum TaxID=1586232 RepID=A0ABD5P609_9EURY|nr:hypothetical protein [Natribaculum luteum]